MRSLLSVFLGILLVALPAIGRAADIEKRPLYFSLIPKKNIDSQIAELQPLIDYLEKQLNRPITIIRPQSYQSVIEGILSQTIDFAILGPASYAKARARDSQVEAFASFSSRKGYLTPQGSYYHSVLFTLKKHGYKSSNELRGKKIALTDPSSTSGSVIPTIYFAKEIGESLNDFFGSLTYAGSHDRAIAVVKMHYVEAAFVSSARVDEAVRNNIIDSKQVVVLWKSQPIHSDPFVFRSGLDDTTRKKLKTAMLSSNSAVKSMFQKLKLVGIEEVRDEDYQAIHQIIARKNRRETSSN